METKIQLLGTLDGVKLFYDPLKKADLFMVMRVGGEAKSGFMLNDPVEAVLESDSKTSWDNVTGIIAGFSEISRFEKIKEKFDEKD